MSGYHKKLFGSYQVLKMGKYTLRLTRKYCIINAVIIFFTNATPERKSSMKKHGNPLENTFSWLHLFCIVLSFLMGEFKSNLSLLFQLFQSLNIQQILQTLLGTVLAKHPSAFLQKQITFSSCDAVSCSTTQNFIWAE